MALKEASDMRRGGIRVAVIGTSNSLMANGYTHPLKTSDKVEEYKNLSLGLSSNLLAAVSARGSIFENFDFCILDFAVNEEQFVRQGLNPHHLHSGLMAVAGRALAAGCMPILLLLPRRDVRSADSLVREAQLDVVRALNLPYFDAIDYVDRLHEKFSINRLKLFKDEGHIQRWLGTAIGYQLLEGMLAIKDKGIDFEERSWSFPAMRAVYAANEVPASRVKRRNSSVASLRYAVMEPGERISFEVPDRALVVGVSSNLSESAGVLRIKGKATHDFDLRNNIQRGGKHPFIASVLTLSAPVRAADGKIEVESLAEDNADAPTRQGVERPREGLGVGPIEFGGLIIRLPEDSQSHQRAAAHHCVDLSKEFAAITESAVAIRKSHNIVYPR